MTKVRRTQSVLIRGVVVWMTGRWIVAAAVCVCALLACGCSWRVLNGKTDDAPAGSAVVAGTNGTEPATDAPAETDSSNKRPGKMIDSGSGEVASAKLPIDPSRLAAGTVLTDAQIAEAGGEDAFFFVEPIDDELFARMQGVSFKDETPVSRDELRHIRVLHKDADGVTHVGEMVLNARIADTCVSIFRQLYDAGYPIEKMRLVEGYGGEDELSMEDDNSSAFNTRIIEGTSQISRHAYGLAVDINTFYNPFIILSTGAVEPVGSEPYTDRSVDSPYKIERGDLCYRLFTEAGFSWGGDWTSRKDYQHFEIPE